jgi:replicative DNA helicase
MDNQSNPERLAPASVEAEEALLGSILINGDVLQEVSVFLSHSDFFILRHAWIWEAMLSIYERGEAVDYLTLTSELTQRSQLDAIGGAAYVTHLMNNTPTHIHAETYGRIVERASLRRQLLTAASKIGHIALDSNDEISGIITAAQSEVDRIAQRQSQQYLVSSADVIDSALREFTDWVYDPAEVRGLRSGLPTLDRHVGGFKAGFYAILAATGMGKSTLAAWVAINFAEQAPGLLITTEMNPVMWMHRVVCDLAGITYLKLRSGQLSAHEQQLVIEIYDRLRRLSENIYIMPVANPTPSQIKALATSLRRQGRGEWMLVDSLNKITVPGVTDIYPVTTAAADMAADLAYSGYVVLATSQIGRNAVGRNNKMPEITDAQGSNKVGENADVALALHRPGYYDENKDSTQTTIKCIKNRYGDVPKYLHANFVRGQGYVEIQKSVLEQIRQNNGSNGERAIPF